MLEEIKDPRTNDKGYVKSYVFQFDVPKWYEFWKWFKETKLLDQTISTEDFTLSFLGNNRYYLSIKRVPAIIKTNVDEDVLDFHKMTKGVKNANKEEGSRAGKN